jgi:hypothetical protein
MKSNLLTLPSLPFKVPASLHCPAPASAPPQSLAGVSFCSHWVMSRSCKHQSLCHTYDMSLTRLIPFALLLSACADTPAPSSTSFFIGESRENVLRAFGDAQPYSRSTSSDGTEKVIYVSGIAKKFIPFYGVWTDTKAIGLTFGPDGKLQKIKTATVSL